MDLRHTHRLFVSEGLAEGSVLSTNPDQAHYLAHVLRLGKGDMLRLFNGRDGEYRGVMAEIGKKDAQIMVCDRTRPFQTEPDLWLCSAPIKKAHYDYMIEKATELGVSDIRPILTGRTQIREVNIERAGSLCRESAEQSDRLSVPVVHAPVSLKEFVEGFPKDRLLIVCAEWGNASPIHDAFHAPDLRGTTKTAIVTGPEGGFSAEELELLRKIPRACFVRLGPRILRADTAAIAALACWQAIQGDW